MSQRASYWTIATLTLLLASTMPVWAHVRVFFGYASGDLHGQPLPASYAGGRFNKEGGDAARRFPIGRRVSAITNLGERTSFVIGRPDSLVHLVSFTLRCIGKCPKGSTVLFWTGNARLQSLRATKTNLDRASLTFLRGRAAVLYQRALKHYAFAPDTTIQEMQLGTPMSETVHGVPGIATVFFPVTLRLQAYGKADVDTSASVFFIYSPSKRKVIYETFGHGEWGPDAKDVLEVKPRLYFRIRGDLKPYFLGAWSGPWESFGHGIFDLRTGRKLTVHDEYP